MASDGRGSIGSLVGRLLDIALTYAIVIVVIAGAYPLLNKQLLETISS
jgi:hypothetical protein